MEFNKNEWLGKWNNFEDFIDSEDPYMSLAWKEAEENGHTMPMFKNGVKNFWSMACATKTKENSNRLSSWIVNEIEQGLSIEWFTNENHSLGKFDYQLLRIIERGLEGTENFLFFANSAPEDSPFRFLLAMAPMPKRNEYLNGGYISHLHFQFGNKEESLINDEKLVNPRWYATMCADEGSLFDRCNIIRGLHHLPKWNTLPEITH